MKSNLAPIVLFAYNRPELLQETISALKNCLLVDRSPILIFCDGPKPDMSKEELENLERVRFLAKSIDFGLNIELICRDKNLGLHDALINGINEVFNIYEKAIFLEDDIIVSKNFLSFMNQTLEFYANEERVFSVTGYAPRLNIPTDYTYDTFFFPRASSWGWGTWKRAWTHFDPNIDDFNEFIQDKQRVKEFQKGGQDQLYTLKNQMKGHVSSWAVKWSYVHYKHNAFCLYPVSSLIDNIGFSSLATHTKSEPNYKPYFVDSSFFEKKVFSFDHHISANKYICEQFEYILKPSLGVKILNALIHFKGIKPGGKGR